MIKNKEELKQWKEPIQQHLVEEHTQSCRLKVGCHCTSLLMKLYLVCWSLCKLAGFSKKLTFNRGEKMHVLDKILLFSPAKEKASKYLAVW